MPTIIHELHVVADFEDRKAGDVITDHEFIVALWLGPWTDRLKLVKRFEMPPISAERRALRMDQRR